MAAPTDLTWDPKDCSLTAVGVEITGFAGDDMVELVPAEPMVVATEVGPTGDTVRVYSSNKLARATFSLASGHPLNRVLYGLAESKAVGPFLLTSLSDGRRAAGPVSYIEAVPSPKLSRSHNPLQWTIAIPRCTVK